MIWHFIRTFIVTITGRKLFVPVMVLFCCAGVVAGLAACTFIYAKGYSYITNDPEACRNCHVMNNVFENWSKGGHQHVAVCNDCHVPHNLVGKLIVKADNGFHHSYAFTFKKVPVAIKARESSQGIVQENCIRCHAAIAAPAVCGASGMEPSLRCVSCHREVGHVHN
jgi:cytochrome c nitrite reductase small subunit